MAATSLSSLREYCYYLVLSSNIHVKEDKMKREYNMIRVPLETLCPTMRSIQQRKLKLQQAPLVQKEGWHYRLDNSTGFGGA